MTDRLGPALAAPLVERLAIIGIGLIGSSIARAARRRNAARTIVIADMSGEARSRASALNLGDEVVAAASVAVANADLVILCAPVGANEAIGREIAATLKPGAIVSDVGSVKGAVLAALAPHLPEGADPRAVAQVRAFWEAIGSNVEVMTASHHDLVLAITSHVPHLIAYNIVGTAYDLEEATRSEVIKFSAGGFRDFTRIAASDPTMWRDVFLNNKDAVLEALGRFNEDLTALQRMIRRGDGDGLFDLFTRTRAIRRGIVEQGQETAAPDFGRRMSEDGESGA